MPHTEPPNPAGATTARSRRGILFKAREAATYTAITAAAAFSVFVTLAIIGVLFSEASRFFALPEVSALEFFTSAEWNPLQGDKSFGMWPLVTGTLMVTAISALVSIPLGLVTAIYLSEYASPRLRSAVKPTLEILAGIPTVVYGFFALTIITPFFLQRPATLLSGDRIFAGYNSTAAGIAVGIMCLPTVVSLSEDALRAVPRSLREGAFAMGATRFDVSVKVVLPAALSGVIAAFILAIARAIGETMIVAIAAGQNAQLATDPTEGSQTMTAYMVQIFLGDATFGSVEYHSSYAVGATLFVMTLALTLLGNIVLRRFRETYE
jgi:phosphate transport system permease protein